MGKIKAVFFDAGGTILTVTKNRFERIRESLLARGVSISLEKIQEVDLKLREILLPEGVWIARPEQEEHFWADYYRMMAEGLGLDDDPEHLGRELLEETYWVDWTVAYPDAIPVLKRLRGKFKLGVISNAYPSMQDALERTGLAAYMDSIILSAQVGAAKPDPLIYQEALRSLKVAPGESVFVDDVEENVQAAEAMGFTAFLIDRSASLKAPGVIHDLYALLDFLETPPQRPDFRKELARVNDEIRG